MHKQIKCTLIRQLPQELSDQGILYLQMTTQGVTRAKCVNAILHRYREQKLLLG